MASLENISEGTFTWTPDRHNGFPWMNGSIRDIVYHVTGDKLVQLNCAFGDGSINWENVPAAKADIQTMLHDLAAAQGTLIAAIESSDLTAKVVGWGGKRFRAADFFLMLIEHDLYHAGQIRYIRNLAE